MSTVNWEWLEGKIIEWFEHAHAKGSDFDSDRDRLDFIQKVFDEVLTIIQENAIEMDKAKKYIKKRDKDRLNILLNLQDQILKEIESALEIIEGQETAAYAASSFSARTHLSGDSDLDFNVLIEDLNPDNIIRITERITKNGYKFTETRGKLDDPNIHYVFAKYVKTDIGEVEIEFKLRDLKPYMGLIHKVHNYLDNKASEKDKIAITWIKSNLKHSKNTKAYAKFKAMYYEWANSHNSGTELMYPIE